jgi:pyruvate/2-oxoglutarate dehydrogenase complex dihydrolipoamide acyltransferase (E2) component
MPFKAPPDLSQVPALADAGLLVDVAVKPGQAVRAGERLAVIEAMKMENILVAAQDGVVAEVLAAKGESLAVDQVILELRMTGPGMRASKPFRILGIQQIAIGGPTRQRLRTLWVDMLGLDGHRHFVSERENVDEDICASAAGRRGRGRPDAADRPDKKPAVHTTPLNHVGLWIDDLPKAVEWLTRTACASRRAASARARPATTSASSTRRQRRVPDRRRRRADRAGAGAARGVRQCRFARVSSA